MAFQKSDQDKLVKLLIIGDSGVGKTCLLMRFCENMFTNNHLTTIGIDFKLKSLEIGGKKVKLQIWDTAGQERFRTITQTYYKGAHGIILTYGVDDKVSFQRFIDYGNNSIENWVRQIKMHAQENVCKILVGNKSDSSDRVVQTEEGQKLADEYGIPFFETSAKAGVNVKQIFESVGQMCYDKLSEQSNNDQEPKIVLNYQSSQPLIEKKKKTTCC